MAEFCSVGDAVDATPDDFLSAVNVPSYTLIRAATLSAVQALGKGIFAVVPPALLLAPVRAGLAVAAGDFSLHLAVHLLGDDALVIVLNKYVIFSIMYLPPCNDSIPCPIISALESPP